MEASGLDQGIQNVVDAAKIKADKAKVNKAKVYKKRGKGVKYIGPKPSQRKDLTNKNFIKILC
jgi:hypothetical protein